MLRFHSIIPLGAFVLHPLKSHLIYLFIFSISSFNRNPPPTLHQPELWSDDFNDFICKWVWLQVSLLLRGLTYFKCNANMMHFFFSFASQMSDKGLWAETKCVRPAPACVHQTDCRQRENPAETTDWTHRSQSANWINWKNKVLYPQGWQVVIYASCILPSNVSFCLYTHWKRTNLPLYVSRFYMAHCSLAFAGCIIQITLLSGCFTSPVVPKQTSPQSCSYMGEGASWALCVTHWFVFVWSCNVNPISVIKAIMERQKDVQTVMTGNGCISGFIYATVEAF